MSLLISTSRTLKNLTVYLVGTVILSGCISTTDMGAGAKRKQLVLVSQEHVEKKANKGIKKMFLVDKKIIYREDDRRIAAILNTLIPYADEYANNRKIKWDAHVYHKGKMNAGAMANGMIVVHSAFLEKDRFSDSQLAYMLAHEMAHVIRQHHREHASWKYAVSPILFTTAILTNGATALVSGFGHDVYGIGFKKATEKEADLLGLEIYAKAGYDPSLAKELFIVAKPLYQKQYPIVSRLPPIFLSHPSFKARVKAIEKHQETVAPMYTNHIEKTSDNLIDYRRGFTLFNPQGKVERQTH